MPAKQTHPALTIPLWLVMLGLGAATLFSLLGRVHWFLELFTHFPLQLAGALLAVTAAALILRRWRLAAIAVLSLLPNLLALSYYFPSSAYSGEAPDLRTVSYNVLTSNRSYEEVLTYLRNSKADLLFVMETNPKWVEALAPLQTHYPYTVKVPRNDNFGMMLLSRHPIVWHELHQFEGTSVPLVHAVVDLNGRSIDLIGCHPAPPLGARMSSSRNAYLKELSEITGNTQNPTVVLGDFNATIWSPFLRDFLKATSLHDTGHRHGFQSSWRRHNPFFSIPIDHVFHNDGLTCTSRQIGPALGSDHRPVIVEFAYRGDAL
jgi:endonuclease/exonuclease/phosphatase (EEP) superfamily protein YafD